MMRELTHIIGGEHLPGTSASSGEVHDPNTGRVQARVPPAGSKGLHGGYGYLTEYGIEKIVRDLRVHQILEGTNEIMHVIVARGLIGAA
ncbi:acyl-CoA dehydrogenase family protein [Sphaerisporangium sp. NPDC051011]|uniref:acyl-CoA dehydrogenase family protein n=1 Tax=Sphaerisporangium sp. NPDC051011 TaxID=3155792 RepID=UPI0033F7B6CF